MTFINTTPFPVQSRVPLSDEPFVRDSPAPLISSNPSVAQQLDIPRVGEFVREVVTWRTPHLGYVAMYINPQEIRIEDRKQITAERTKGGFVIQYAGEELTRISINGTTGSSGIEGINILESIYRSEQEAFEGVAIALEEMLSNIQLNTLTSNLLDASPLAELNIFQVANDAFRNFGRPQPTLASLAANLDMFFQGVLYRGYFESFSVTESASEPGWFNYSMVFMAYAKQGKRRNFMPWHRQPINPANVDANPLSFQTVADAQIVNTPNLPSDTADGPNNRPPDLNVDGDLIQQFFDRSTSTAADSSGGNLSGRRLGSSSQGEQTRRNF